MKGQKLKGFISYAHARAHLQYSELLIEGLKDHLINSEIIDPNLWHDGLLPLGKDWNEIIQEKVKTCDFAILLVSSKFLNSARL